MSEQPLHIVELRVDNVKRLQAVTVRPDGATVLIGGANAQGKTSLLDAIEMALGGGKTIPVEPVRRGARKARVVVDLGELVVERTFSPKGTALEVRNKEGVPQKSPQALLDSLTAKVCFDPLAFAREDPTKQDAILKQVLGLDFSELEGRRAKLYADRRDANRDAKALEARLDACQLHVAPAEEVSVAELTAEIERMRAYLAADWVTRTAAPAWLDLAGLTEHAMLLRELIEITDAPTAQAAREQARKARSAADAADAARSRRKGDLRLTVELLQQSALDLVERMIALGTA